VTTQNGLSGVVISDKEYPTRVSYSLINNFLGEFLMKYPDWRNTLLDTWLDAPGSSTSNRTAETTPSNLEFPELANYLKKFQNPEESDSIMRVQKELDETKEILVSSLFI
jgi:synaptobrevin family protein YKT6